MLFKASLFQNRSQIKFSPNPKGFFRLKTGYNLGVLRSALFALLGLAILNGSGLAQRTAPGVHGGGQRGFSGGVRVRRGMSSSGVHRRAGTGSGFFPYYFDSFGSEEPEADAMPGQPQIVMQRTPEPVVPKGQVIEISPAANSAIAKLLPPTIFVLANGERLESRRFVLTASVLSVSIERQQRSVPLGQLDINATVAANHERGIDLRIPDDRNEISVGF